MNKNLNIIKDRIVKGKRQITIEIDPTENGELVIINDECFYRLGYPLETDVISADQLLNAHKVYWCIVEQKWKDE